MEEDEAMSLAFGKVSRKKKVRIKFNTYRLGKISKEEWFWKQKSKLNAMNSFNKQPVSIG